MSRVNVSDDHEQAMNNATKPAANKQFECGNSGAGGQIRQERRHA
ncbi:MAG TPA: hypothetical protein VFC54_03750 [Pseudolabrys sp.]|nr:hypothetical protein [Pseudolabrys sp.]